MTLRLLQQLCTCAAHPFPSQRTAGRWGGLRCGRLLVENPIGRARGGARRADQLGCDKESNRRRFVRANPNQGFYPWAAYERPYWRHSLFIGDALPVSDSDCVAAG